MSSQLVDFLSFAPPHEFQIFIFQLLTGVSSAQLLQNLLTVFSDRGQYHQMFPRLIDFPFAPQRFKT